MRKDEMDVIVPVGEMQWRIVGLSLEWLQKHYPKNILYIVSSRLVFEKSNLVESEKVKFLDQDEVSKDFTLASIQSYFMQRINDDSRASWYFQQFVKMSISALEFISEDYLVWDADCIMLNSIEFFDKNGRTIFTGSKENHQPYFDFNERLVGLDKEVDFSFISEHMLFNKHYMQGIIRTISPNGHDWVRTILTGITDEHLSGSGFSEYELYGNYLVKHHPESITLRTLETERDGTIMFGDYPKKIDLLLASYLYKLVSFEQRQTRGVERFLRLRLVYRILKRWWRQLWFSGTLQQETLSAKKLTMERSMAKLFEVANLYLEKGAVKTILDVGARDLKESLFLAAQFPSSKILAFECNPQTLPICHRRAGENDRITLIDKAVNDYDGFCKFYPIDPKRTITTWSDGNPGASSLFKANGAYPIETYVQGEIEVECVRIDTVLKTHGIGKVDVIWMDLQGAELLALKGLGDYLKLVDIVVTEVEATAMYEGQCLDDHVISFLEQDFQVIDSDADSEWGRDIIFINKRLSKKR